MRQSQSKDGERPLGGEVFLGGELITILVGIRVLDLRDDQGIWEGVGAISSLSTRPLGVGVCLDQRNRWPAMGKKALN